MPELSPAAHALVATFAAGPWPLLLGVLSGAVAVALSAAREPLAWFFGVVGAGLIGFGILDAAFILR